MSLDWWNEQGILKISGAERLMTDFFTIVSWSLILF